MLLMASKSLRLKSSVASKRSSKHLWGNIYFAGDDTLIVMFTRALILQRNCSSFERSSLNLHI